MLSSAACCKVRDWRGSPTPGTTRAWRRCRSGHAARSNSRRRPCQLACGRNFPNCKNHGHYYGAALRRTSGSRQCNRRHYRPLARVTPAHRPEVFVVPCRQDRFHSLPSSQSGEKPTGSRDPFALRRAAQGIIRLILENGSASRRSRLQRRSCGFGHVGRVFCLGSWVHFVSMPK